MSATREQITIAYDVAMNVPMPDECAEAVNACADAAERLVLIEAERDLFKIERDEALAKLAAVEAENERLRAALRPFTQTLVRAYMDCPDDKPVFGCGNATFDAGHFRAARAALESEARDG